MAEQVDVIRRIREEERGRRRGLQNEIGRLQTQVTELSVENRLLRTVLMDALRYAPGPNGVLVPVNPR